VFPQRLKALRKEKKLTAKELGEKFSLAESTISGYETGARKPDMDTINKFADFFGVSVDYLLGRTNVRNISQMHGDVDPEIEELLEKIRSKGAEIEASAILRTASQLEKEQLQDILKVFEIIAKNKNNQQ